MARCQPLESRQTDRGRVKGVMLTVSTGGVSGEAKHNELSG